MSLGLVFAILLGVVVTSNDACSCLERHPQEVFCSAHFAIRAKVLSQEDNLSNFTRIFDLRILKIFKGTWKLNQTTRSSLRLQTSQSVGQGSHDNTPNSVRGEAGKRQGLPDHRADLERKPSAESMQLESGMVRNNPSTAHRSQALLW